MDITPKILRVQIAVWCAAAGARLISASLETQEAEWDDGDTVWPAVGRRAGCKDD